MRLLDVVGVITGVSGGSFTALAYGVYGDKLFEEYEQRFLKRDVQGELVAGLFNPTHWPRLWSSNWGRSEMAAELYDKILFNGATFADLDRNKSLLVLASATDISTGAQVTFDQFYFDAMCSNLDAVPLSRAAAASSAVPVALSPVTLSNYGGTCNYAPTTALQADTFSARQPRTVARAKRLLDELRALTYSKNRPYIHLVDGGVADNVGMRSVLSTLEMTHARQPLQPRHRLTHSSSTPKTSGRCRAMWPESSKLPARSTRL